jgi:hypothetical protein
MTEFFRAGGWPMWLVLCFGLLALYGAARYAINGDPVRLPRIRALTWATVFAIASGVASDFMAVMWHASGPLWGRPDLHRMIMRGLGEAVTPAVLGFALLALVWALVAVGVMRDRAR